MVVIGPRYGIAVVTNIRNNTVSIYSTDLPESN